MSKRWCVRVVQTWTDEGEFNFKGGDVSKLVECLRYADLVTIHELHAETLSSTILAFDVECPKSIRESKVWAESNAEKMRSFGFNAVAAPSTREK